MKKIFCQLCCLVLLLSAGIVSSCSNDGEITDKGYNQLRVWLVYPTPSPYKYYFNGKEITNYYFSRDTESGKIAFVDKTSNEQVFEFAWNKQMGSYMEFIQLPGKDIELYKAEDYISFRPKLIIWDDYTLKFNGQLIFNQQDNFLKKSDAASGTMELFAKDNNEPVGTIENVTIADGESPTVLQISGTEMMLLTNDGEEDVEDPATENLTKVRFLYKPSEGYADVNAIRVEVWATENESWMDFYPTGQSVTVKKGEISDYIELDIAQLKESSGEAAWWMCDIYNAETNELIASHDDDGPGFGEENWDNVYEYKNTYKFQTLLITYGYSSAQVVMGTEWHPTNE